MIMIDLHYLYLCGLIERCLGYPPRPLSPIYKLHIAQDVLYLGIFGNAKFRVATRNKHDKQHEMIPIKLHMNPMQRVPLLILWGWNWTPPEERAQEHKKANTPVGATWYMRDTSSPKIAKTSWMSSQDGYNVASRKPTILLTNNQPVVVSYRSPKFDLAE